MDTEARSQRGAAEEKDIKNEYEGELISHGSTYETQCTTVHWANKAYYEDFKQKF